MIATVSDALRLLRERRVVTLTPVDGFSSLVEAVAGGPVKGSWWGHPKGRVIFALAEALEDSSEALVTKLVGGKVTFVHRSLWPALVRVVTDGAWRRRAAHGLSTGARRLWARVERSGTARLDRLPEAAKPAGRRSLAKARAELEALRLVQVAQQHTERGSHATVLRAWAAWATPEVKVAAARLAFADAAGVLAAAGIDVESGP